MDFFKASCEVMKKIFLLELNEFNKPLLQEAAQVWRLKNLEKLVHFSQTETFTEDTYESDFLEPWVQWVSVHTGKPSSIHQIKHLGDVPDLEISQLWETLSEKGIRCGIWGAMNASRGRAKNCPFFFPDPWTASETAYPEELNRLLDPLRYISKNYLHFSSLKIKPLITLFLRQKLGLSLLKEFFLLIKNVIRFQAAPFVFIAFIEYLSALLFLKYKERYQPDFSLLFINTIAHLQHHHWKGSSLRQNSRLKLGMQYLDRILGKIFAGLGSQEILVVTNALSQKNTHDEKPWILYRQIDQASFLQTVGIAFEKVEPHMTHDAHLFFATQEDCKQALQALEQAEILGQKLFHVESYPETPKKIFYRIAFTDPVPPETSFVLKGKTFDFQKLFKPIVQRTGKHIPYGTIYCTHPIFPKKIKNHEIYDHLVKTFS